jgi:hypothetical protein
MVTGMLIRDAGFADQLIQERKRKGIDRHDEVWEGMYVMPSMPNNAHQLLVGDLDDVFREVAKKPGSGRATRERTSAIAARGGTPTTACPTSSWC